VSLWPAESRVRGFSDFDISSRLDYDGYLDPRVKEVIGMNGRERVLAAMRHQEADRIPIMDGPWAATIKRWRQEGLSGEVSPAEYFGFELIRFQPDTSPRLPVKIVEEDEEYFVETTPYGGLRKNHKDYSTTPEIMDYPCKSRDDWERLKERLKPDRGRVDWEGRWIKDSSTDERGEDSILESYKAEWRNGLEGCRKAQSDGMFSVFASMVGYDKLQHYVATEDLLVAIATDPDWIRDMYETDATLAIQMYEIMRDGGFVFDGAWLTCDLGYRNGLLFSPRHFEEQLRPTFRRLFDYFKGEGLPVILHSCGQVKDLIPYFVEDGLSCLQPLEVKAGMDLLQLKEAYGKKICFMGGIDVRAMADPDPSVIEREIRTKIPLAKRGGGYIYHSDHSVPNNVSFEQYKRVMKLVLEYGKFEKGT
jgi:uroporphyrinogen decarboxylase